MKLKFSYRVKPGIGGVYGIINSDNGKIYIGSSVDIYTRWFRHRGELSRGIHPNKYLQSAYLKHPEAFECIIIQESKDWSNLFSLEQLWMNFYRSYDKKYGYNHQLVAGRGNLGIKPSAETRLKLHEANKGRILGAWTDERCRNISRALKGKPSAFKGKKHSKESRINMVEGQKRRYQNGGIVWNKGKHYSTDLMEKLRITVWENEEVQSRKGKTRIERKCKFIPVMQLSLDGDPIRQWDSIIQATRALNNGSNAFHIGNVCRGKSKTAYGFKWKYA